MTDDAYTDAEIESLRTASDTHEALGWLRGGTEEDFRSIGELETTEESIQLVQLIYQAGATEVLAVEIDRFDEGQNTDTLLIKLPDNREKRHRLLEWAGAVAQQQGFEPEHDTGQSYLVLTLA
jgi:hypothetical protein